MTLQFIDPPAPTRGINANVWAPIFAELREQPGDWAIVVPATTSASTAMNIKLGKLGGAKPHEYEATSRSNHDGTYAIYARYVGTNQ